MQSEILLAAIRTAVANPVAEHRLFRSGKLAGLFPSRAGESAAAATAAVRDGLLETVRTEDKRGVVVEWVRSTPAAVRFLADHDSPKAVLRELQATLAAMRAEYESRTAAVLVALASLSNRITAALVRADVEPVESSVPWAAVAVEYLDQIAVARGPDSTCPLPELFAAVRDRHADLTLAEFHAGVRRLREVRAVRLHETETMPEPEFAVVVGGKTAYAASR